jgi:hypothetical protein
MITNQRQYALAKAEASRFEDALAKEKAKGPRKGVHPRIHQAKLDGLQSQLDELNAEVNEFEALSSPDTTCEFTVTSVLDLSTVLIQAQAGPIRSWFGPRKSPSGGDCRNSSCSTSH